MSMVIVLEVIVAIVVLAVVARFAVRDTRQRRDASPEQRVVSEDTASTQPRDAKQEAEQRPSDVDDQPQGEEVAALSASSTTAEPTRDTV